MNTINELNNKIKEMNNEVKNKTEDKEKQMNLIFDKDKEEIINKYNTEFENKEKKIQELESKIKRLEKDNNVNQKNICEIT